MSQIWLRGQSAGPPYIFSRAKTWTNNDMYVLKSIRGVFILDTKNAWFPDGFLQQFPQIS